ncbi:hypothetical protein, partial [Arthrobacter pigmenti]
MSEIGSRPVWSAIIAGRSRRASSNGSVAGASGFASLTLRGWRKFASGSPWTLVRKRLWADHG